MISSNWQQLVKQQQVDPLNPARVHNGKKRKFGTVPSANTASNRHRSNTPSVRPSSATFFSSASPGRSVSTPLPSPTVLHPSASPSSSQPTLLLAMDCEMVGIGADGSQHALARCSIVNSMGAVLYDRYVQPIEAVTDYRTAVSGILPHHIQPANAIPFSECQLAVAALLARRIVIGHALHSDLAVLQLSHPRHLIRDTSRWKGLCPTRPRALRVLAEEQLGVIVQSGQHDSVEDARAALQLYMKHRKEWELSIKQAKRAHKQQPNKAANAQQQQRHIDGRVRVEPIQSKQQQQQEADGVSSSRWSSEGPVIDTPLTSTFSSSSSGSKRMKRP